MVWHFIIAEDARCDIESLDAAIARRIKARLSWFIEHFDETVPLRLSHAFIGYYKLRAGDWRIIYEVNEEEMRVVVHAVGRRDKIYKRNL